jgi:hypothetical protein
MIERERLGQATYKEAEFHQEGGLLGTTAGQVFPGSDYPLFRGKQHPTMLASRR